MEQPSTSSDTIICPVCEEEFAEPLEDEDDQRTRGIEDQRRTGFSAQAATNDVLKRISIMIVG